MLKFVLLNFRKNIICLFKIIFLGIFIFPIVSFASTSDGTVLKATSTDGYAWGENVGWVNFGTTQGDVHITSSAITGYAWDSIYGWINLSPTGSGVVNDGNGNLSGFAWSQGAGFIDFTGVSVNASGKFTGQAYGAIYGRINFDCSTCNVVTDWRIYQAPTTNPPSSGVGSPILITDTRTIIIPPQVEEIPIIPNIPVSSEYITPNIPIPTEVIDTPAESQPVVDITGIPTIGKTFTTQPIPTIFDTNQLLNNLLKLFNNFTDWARRMIGTLINLINTPIGSVVTKSISVLGIISGLTNFFVSMSLSDIWLVFLRFLGLLLGAIGLKKKSRSWGTVYDSVTKRPLDPVYVSLIDASTNKEIASAITDLDGRYGFLVVPGKYKIVAQKTNYIQPSVKMQGKSFDEVYNDLYFGEEILITEDGQIITKNIPMDSLSFDWNEFAKIKMDVNTFMRGRDITWAKISSVIFFIGAIVAFIAVFAAPEPYNYIIAGLYIFAYILNYSVLKTKKSGSLVEKITKMPLSFAIIKIFREGEDTPIAKKIADKFGSYYVLIPNGKYYIIVDKKNDDSTYSEIFHSPVVAINGGVINEDLAL